jgi:hypothetical protein
MPRATSARSSIGASSMTLAVAPITAEASRTTTSGVGERASTAARILRWSDRMSAA